MDENAEIVEKLYQRVLEGCQDEYAELQDRWKTIEAKAQGTAASAGVLLVGALAFVRQLKIETDDIIRWLLSVIVILLGVIILCCVLALRVKAVPSPPRGKALRNEVITILRVASNSPDPSELRNRFIWRFNDEISFWIEVNKETLAANDSKGSLVSIAQHLFFWAMILVASITLLIIFQGGL